MIGKKILGGAKRRPIYEGLAGSIARAVDATVGLAFPEKAKDMRIARVKSAALVAYEGARVTRMNPKTSSASADAEVASNFRELRNMSRTMERDDAHASSVISIHEECIVGEGVVAQAACTPEETGLSPERCEQLNRDLTAAFKDWAESEADATGVGSFYDLQVLALRGELVDGDSFGHAFIDGDTIACEIIDADRIESPNAIDRDNLRMGVELDARGRHVAYHVLTHHPDDSFFNAAVTPTPVRHAATDEQGYSIVQQCFRRKRAGQTRGLPLLTPALLYTRHLHHYLDSELIAARAASNFAMFIKRSVTPDDADILPVQGDESATELHFLEQLEPGVIEYLNQDEEPFSFTPNRPGSSFEPFVIRLLRAIASSAGLSYEVVTRDFARMNLSSARAMLREIRRGFDLRRARLVRSFCRPWYENVVRQRAAIGVIDVPPQFFEDPRPFLRHRWIAPSYGMVDPTTDVEASDSAVRANLSTPQEEAAKYGRNSSEVLRARAQHVREAMDLEAEFDLPEGTLTAPLKPGTASPGGAANQQDPATDPATDGNPPDNNQDPAQ